VPRIRTIKPEFWVDEKIVELDPWARLLFIGLWNFADDQGYIEYSPRRIKMQIFPGDSFDVSPLLQSLLEAGLVVAYQGPAGPVLHVANWSKHQKVSNAANPRFDPSELEPFNPLPDPPLEGSRAVQSPLPGKERKGKEEEGKGSTSTSERASRADADPEPTPDPLESTRLDVENVCRYLADAIEANGSKRPSITKKWRQEARYLIDRDGRTVEQIKAAIDWCQASTFWRSNVMSMPTLRRQYDRLRLAAMEDRSRASPARHQPYRNPEDPSIYEGAL
jgi:hypothetical protein